MDEKEARNVVKIIHWQDKFPFTYDVWKSVDVNTNFPDPEHNVNDFKLGAIVAGEFQILLRNFKASKKEDAIKTYSFWLLGIYFVNDLVQSTMSYSTSFNVETTNKW